MTIDKKVINLDEWMNEWMNEWIKVLNASNWYAWGVWVGWIRFYLNILNNFLTQFNLNRCVIYWDLLSVLYTIV